MILNHIAIIVSSEEGVEFYKQFGTEGEVSIAGETTSLPLLNEEQRKRIVSNDEPMYIIDCYRNVIGNNVDHPEYEELYAIWIDGYKIGSVFKKSVISHEQ